MKKQIKSLAYFFLLLSFFSCEDHLEGSFMPSTPQIGDFTYTAYTHWVFSYNTEGKADGEYFIGTNPDTKSKIYIDIDNEGVINAWAVKQLNFTIITNNAQTNDSFDLTDTVDPIPGKPFATTLPQIAHSSKCHYLLFCTDNPQNFKKGCIYVKQVNATPFCIPQKGSIQVFVPAYL